MLFSFFDSSFCCFALFLLDFSSGFALCRGDRCRAGELDTEDESLVDESSKLSSDVCWGLLVFCSESDFDESLSLGTRERSSGTIGAFGLDNSNWSFVLQSLLSRSILMLHIVGFSCVVRCTVGLAVANL